MKSLQSLALFAGLAIVLTFAACKNRKNIADKIQRIRPNTQALVDSISNDNVITTRGAARMPGIAPQYRRRQNLIKYGNREEMKELLKHENAVVRLTAFEGLYRSNAPRMDVYFQNMIDDKSEIHYVKGDLSTRLYTLEYAYLYILGLELNGKPLPEEREEFGSAYVPNPALVEKAARQIMQLRGEL